MVISVLGYTVTVLDPPASTAPSVHQMAMIWINGAKSDPESYVKIAKEF